MAEAREKASAAMLDLIIVSESSDPPVARILNLGKLKYEQQKKRNLAKRNQKTIAVKEIKMRPFIDSHDYQTKLKAMIRFLNEGDKVKVTVRFRGRELANTQIGLDLIQRVIKDTHDIAQTEQEPQFERRQYTTVLGQRAKGTRR